MVRFNVVIYGRSLKLHTRKLLCTLHVFKITLIQKVVNGGMLQAEGLGHPGIGHLAPDHVGPLADLRHRAGSWPPGSPLT